MSKLLKSRAETKNLKSKPELNKYLHDYARLRGVRWSRYSKPSKLRKEHEELVEALLAYENNPSAQNLQHLKEESADVLFCLLGISEKAGFDLNDAVEHKTKKDRGRNMT